MQPRKKIEIKSKESQKSYLDDIKPSSQETQIRQVRKSFLISKVLEDKIQAYIYQKRTQGEIYYSQTDLIEEALDRFFNTEK